MQSKKMSIIETCVSTAIGFVVAIITTQLVLPFYGHDVTLSENGQITTIFTVVSLIRGYYVRRFFTHIGTMKSLDEKITRQTSLELA
jgi:hypothetical protein